MKRSFNNRAAAIAIGLMFGAMVGVSSSAAASAPIEAAKNECIVGEQHDGYLGVVTGASVNDALRREVRDINQTRKRYYADLAQANGVSVEVTAALTAEKLMQKAKPGHCLRDAEGNWAKR